ncbi:MAG: cobalt-zinc-cadmium efflux system membrane fusion protein [Myxococcota bacterium]|jgi:cobalt-zinc-cadmium efflux system membrane fusion protein
MRLHPARLLLALALFVPTLACVSPLGGSEHAAEDAEEGDGRPDIAVTLYEGSLELFMEHPAFVIGQESPLIAHFTDTRSDEAFEWVTSGRAIARLAYEGGGEDVFLAEELLRNGIFKPIVVPTQTGRASFSLTLEGHPASGTVVVGDVMVHGSIEEAVAAAPEEGSAEPTVGYLKESQWKTVYATALAAPRPLRGGIRATGDLKPVAGQAGELVAPFSGRVVPGRRVPYVGMKVVRGELLGHVVPIGGDRAESELALSRAMVRVQLAEHAADRAERLHPAVISAHALELAKADLEVARAELAAAKRQVAAFTGGAGAGIGFELRAPVDGVVTWADVVPGQVVDAGERLVAVVNVDRLWLEAQVFETDAAEVDDAVGAMFTVSGSDRVVVLDEASGSRLVAVGAAVDPITRTVPVIFEFPNTGKLKPGMYAKVTVFTDDARPVLAVPAQAVVEDGGLPVIYVMDGGESFFKRRVTLGMRDGDYVEVVAGVSDRERVVSRGAYEIKLATASGAIPEHGHQH